MEDNELKISMNAEETQEIASESDSVSWDTAKSTHLWPRVRKKLPTLAIWGRYLLPLVFVLALFVMSFFYNVRVYIGGKLQEVSVLRLYLNTFKGTHNYLGGTTMSGRSWYYGILTAGAIVGVLAFVIALFLAGLAAYTAVRAFLAGQESEESDRMKLIFKIAFPNRVWLYLSELLILVPLLYPNFFSLVSKNFLAIGSEGAVFVQLNRPLIVGGVFLVLLLALALIIPRYERRKRMNMFLLHRMEEAKQEIEENEPEVK